MNPTLDAALRSWPFDPWLLFGLAVTGSIYVRGWSVFRRRDPRRWHPGQPAAFLGGLGALYLALASPIEPFAGLLLQVHMIQHLLLMMAVPPLLWWGDPLLPMVRGLPRPIREVWVGPLFGLDWLRNLAVTLSHPVAALVIYVGMTWLWHVPAAYELALQSPSWHYIQHLCFLGAGLLFWYPVVRPYPARPAWSEWWLVPYLLLADVSNTVLSGLLTFSDRVLYPHYALMPPLGRWTALDDQAAAGVTMWVPGSAAFLVPLAVIGVKLLFGRNRIVRPIPHREEGRADSDRQRVHGRIALPLATSRQPFNLLHVPFVGGFLRWRHTRTVMQTLLLLLAGAVIVDGFTGPHETPLNLAGVLPWIHWRGLLVLGLLAVGNLFCSACPFTLPRKLAARWLPTSRAWPRRFRSKWLAISLLFLFFWAYEAFALWDRPWTTAWIVVGYFAAAFTIDGVFRAGSFCKYVCPIGQFNFAGSTISPLGVAVRDPTVCRRCTTRDCVQACDMGLAPPRKSGNLDCTLCLDCVRVCPHDNLAVAARLPGNELWANRPRPGIGRLSRRLDLAVLIAVLVFAAFANAAGMIAPVSQQIDSVAKGLGLTSAFWVVTAFYLAALCLLPLLLIGGAAILSRRWGRLPPGTATRFVFTLMPLGFGMWLAHYGFHLATGYEAVMPAILRFLGFGIPEWAMDCCKPAADWLLKAELLVLDLGLLLSLYAAHRVARSAPRPGRALAPWVALIVGLFAVGVWIVFQPMQMRGVIE